MSIKKAECKECGNRYPYEEIEPDDAPVATCPNCGGHRFKGVHVENE